MVYPRIRGFEFLCFGAFAAAGFAAARPPSRDGRVPVSDSIVEVSPERPARRGFPQVPCVFHA